MELDHQIYKGVAWMQKIKGPLLKENDSQKRNEESKWIWKTLISWFTLAYFEFIKLMHKNIHKLFY